MYSKRLSLAFAGLMLLFTAALLSTAPMVRAATSPEGQCQNGRYTAAAKYAQCEQGVLARSYLREGFAFEVTVLRCRVKYADTWTKLQAKASGTGSTCDAARFVDNGDGTVSDNSTGLQWEKKTNLDDTTNFADPHDADNSYTWSATSTAADGTAFTSFLATLNGGGCFAGQCDWRLPTRAELQTIVDATQGVCGGGSGACIDPIFGPTTAINFYWSATTGAGLPFIAWFVDFSSASVVRLDVKNSDFSVRAVRAGL